VHPILVRIAGLDIAWYGLLISCGTLVGVFLAIRRAKTVGVPTDLILDLTFYGVIIGFIGSRVFFILGDLRGFVAYPKEYIFTRQGYVFFGGLVFAVAFAVWYLKRKRCDLWQIGDIMAPSVAVGHMFGRIGCFFSGCCYGRLCPTGWERLGVSFPQVPAPFGFWYFDHPEWAAPDGASSLPILPVQLYEAGANFLIFLGLMWLWRHRRFRGQVFVAYLGAYGIVRFLLEFLRGDYADMVMFGWLQRGQLSQLSCLVAIVAALVLWLRLRRAPLESPVAASQGTAEVARANHPKPPSAPKNKHHRRR